MSHPFKLALTRYLSIPLFLAQLVVGLEGCSSSTSPIASSGRKNYTPASSGPNVLAIQIGGTSLCGIKGYTNEPCTSVTVCEPGSSNCQTISDILVDTGSVGLRIFSNVLTLNLTAVQDSEHRTLAECAQFGTGSDWGPIMMADVGLALESVVTVPIQVIHKSLFTPPSACLAADISPDSAGFNGILGVNVFKQDCGTDCALIFGNQTYYACSGTRCVGTTVALAQQVQNPVARLPIDNNGVIVELPLLSSDNSVTSKGSLVLGIDTQSNNSSSGASMISTDTLGNIITQFNGFNYTLSFLDSGSNAIYFPGPSSLAYCDISSEAAGFYCPGSTVNLSATMASPMGDSGRMINFGIGNALSIFQSSNLASDYLGGPSGNEFDWGLPFFYGRKVYVGIENQSSTLGAGPYEAF